MRTKQTFSTLFWIQTTRAINNEALIYIRITVDGKRVNLSLKRRMSIDLWDSSKKKAKGTSALSRQINFYLEEVNSQIFQIYQDLKYKGELITAELVKAHYTSGTDDQGKSLMDIIKYHNAKTANTLAPGSIRNFGVTESYVQKFLKKHRKTSDVYLKQLNSEFSTDLQVYLSMYIQQDTLSAGP